MTRTFTALSICTLALSSSLLGCGGGSDAGETEDFDAQLSIVGDAQLSLGEGARATLQVRYHDSSGAPLLGEVTFEIAGDGAASLDVASAVTDAEGNATVTLTAGRDDATFSVEASAADAAPASWSIDVQKAANPLRVEGNYTINSNFVVASGTASDVAEVANTFVAMTDDPNDPATWLIDILLEQLDSSIVSSAVGLARPGLDSWINDGLLEGANADYPDKARQVGSDLAQIAGSFGLDSQLVIRTWDEEGKYRATHTLSDYVVTIDGERHAVALSELSVGPIASPNIEMARNDALELTVGDHAMVVPYGELTLAAMERFIIPAVQPDARTIHELLTSFVDCTAVGQSIADYITLGSASTYDGPCNLALSSAASFLESKLLDIDQSAVQMSLSGKATLGDSDGDGTADQMYDGQWFGSLDVAGDNWVLDETKSGFTGERTGD